MQPLGVPVTSKSINGIPAGRLARFTIVESEPLAGLNR
jgi:hypothetical protein